MAEAPSAANVAAATATPAVREDAAYGKGRWITVSVLSALQLIQVLQGNLVNNLFPVIRADLGLNLGSLGVLTGVGKFARMLFGPIWAMLGDRFSRKLILVITGLWGVFIIAVGLAQTFNQLLILYAIGVLGTVSAEPISNGLVSELFRSGERGKVYGTMRSGVGAGYALIIPLLGQLAGVPNNQGWRIGMFVLGGAGVLAGLLTWVFVADPRLTSSDIRDREAAIGEAATGQAKPPDFRLANVPKLLAIPTVALLGIQLLFITGLVLFAFQVTFLVDVRKYTTQHATLITSVFFLGFTISSFLGGMLGDWFARRNPRTGRVILMQLWLVAFSLASFLAMQVNWPTAAVETAVWLGFGLLSSIGFSGAVLPMVSEVVLPQYRATAFAVLFSFIQGAFTALISLAMGDLAQQYGLRLVMLCTITIPYAINAVFWFAFYKVYPRDQERMQQQLAGHAIHSDWHADQEAKP